MEDHSKAKLELLREYLKIYVRIISRDKLTDTIHIIDLFCGEGQYADDMGSPLVFYETIKEFSYATKGSKKKRTNFHLVFNDTDKAKFLMVKDLLENRPPLPDCYIDYFNEEFHCLLPRILRLITMGKRDKYLIFLDPYGYKDICSDDIRKLLAGNKSEIIWFIPISFMYRFAKYAPDSDDPSFYPLRNILSDFFPSGLPHYRNQIEFINELLTRFRGSFAGYWIDTFTIERDSNSWFCLFFFTSHIRGFEKMLEAKWAIDEREGRGYRSDQKVGELFSLNETWKFPEIITRFLKAPACRTNKEIYEFTLQNGFLPKHANSVLKELDRTGRLRISSFQKIKKGSYYLGYGSHSKYPEKVLQFTLNK